MNKRMILSGICLALCSVAPCEAASVFCTNCSNQFMQSLDRVTNVEQLMTLMSQLDNDISQTDSQIKMVQQDAERNQNMQQNTKSLDQNLIELGTLLAKLAIQKAEADAAERKYKELYPDQQAVGAMTRDEYEENWDAWSAENNQATQATYQLSAKMLDELKDSDQLDAFVNDLLKKPAGRMEAAQAGNQLSAMTLKGVRSLLAVMSTQAKQQAQAAASQQKEREAQEEQQRKIMKTTGDWGKKSTPAKF